MAVAQIRWEATPEERFAAYNLLKFITRLCSISLSLIVLANYIFYPAISAYIPDLSALQAACIYAVPFLAFALCLGFPGLFEMVPYRTHAVKFDLLFIALFPWIFAGLWFFEGNMLRHGIMPDVFQTDWLKNPYYIGSGAALLAGLLISARQKSRLFYLQAIAFYISMAFAAPLGLVVSYDVLFDKASPQIYERMVAEKNIKYESLRFAPLKSKGDPELPKILTTVTDDLFRQIKVGDVLCVYIHPGAADIPWTQISTCPGKT